MTNTENKAYGSIEHKQNKVYRNRSHSHKWLEVENYLEVKDVAVVVGWREAHVLCALDPEHTVLVRPQDLLVSAVVDRRAVCGVVVGEDVPIQPDKTRNKRRASD